MFKKDHKKYSGLNKGDKHKPSSIEKLKNIRHNSLWNLKVSNSLKGKNKSEEHKRKIKESRQKQIMKRGSEHWNWKGGIKKSYPPEFNRSLKLKIRTRDDFTCVLCGKNELQELEDFNRVLCVNHIDFNRNNCDEDNLNTLCLRCNLMINKNRDYWTNYFKKDALLA